MITNRIYEWARTQPTKTAMIHGDRLYTYAVFARAIEATKKFFADQNLLAGLTAIVCINNIADAWIVIFGLRSIGLNTICVSSLAPLELSISKTSVALWWLRRKKQVVSSRNNSGRVLAL